MNNWQRLAQEAERYVFGGHETTRLTGDALEDLVALRAARSLAFYHSLLPEGYPDDPMWEIGPWRAIWRERLSN